MSPVWVFIATLVSEGLIYWTKYVYNSYNSLYDGNKWTRSFNIMSLVLVMHALYYNIQMPWSCILALSIIYIDIHCHLLWHCTITYFQWSSLTYAVDGILHCNPLFWFQVFQILNRGLLINLSVLDLVFERQAIISILT